jgi:outer membrane lipoprotein SlyB
LLLANALWTNPDDKRTATVTALTGLGSVPVAVLAARKLDLDPGDTQLVRDAAFWGLALATLGTLGFAGTTNTFEYYPNTYTEYESPSAREVATAGLVGLYGGLGLGLWAAHASEISLERVRVTTWGGYGGAVLGLLFGSAMDDEEARGGPRGAAIGALAGLAITFLTTAKLDGIPAADAPTRASWTSRLSPSLVPVPTVSGRTTTAFGISGTL